MELLPITGLWVASLLCAALFGWVVGAKYSHLPSLVVKDQTDGQRARLERASQHDPAKAVANTARHALFANMPSLASIETEIQEIRSREDIWRTSDGKDVIGTLSDPESQLVFSVESHLQSSAELHRRAQSERPLTELGDPAARLAQPASLSTRV